LQLHAALQQHYFKPLDEAGLFQSSVNSLFQSARRPSHRKAMRLPTPGSALEQLSCNKIVAPMLGSHAEN
jgi:hypothetical protein